MSGYPKTRACVKIVTIGAAATSEPRLPRAFGRDGNHAFIGVARRTPPPHPRYSAAAWRSADVYGDAEATLEVSTMAR